MLVKNYSTGSKVLHWFIALIVILMLSGSFFLDDLPEPLKDSAIFFHKSFGLAVLCLMVFRIIWIIYRGKPELPVTVPKWERLFSRVVQYSLYVALILMPLCGWVMSVAAGHTPSFFGLMDWPLPGVPLDKAFAHNMFEVHETLAWIIIGLLFLHIAGGLKHHFIDKDDVLKKMM